jgi:hypothetical protein
MDESKSTMPILIPILLVAALAFGARAASARAPQSHDDGAPISALQTYCAFMRMNQLPPPFVVDMAVREAISIGDHVLAAQISHIANHAMSPLSLPVPAVSSPSPQAPAAPVLQSRAPVRSPIDAVSDAEWDALCGALVRDTPDAASDRRVGKYGASKTRLEQIGIEPASILGSSDAQDDALNADLAAAHAELDADGTLRKHIGRAIEVPDMDEPLTVSLSGVLGVASVAGVSGARNWLASEGDRKRFPFTTNLFLRTNGVF